MSYTADYELGRLCEPINRAYADRHGYAFFSRVYPPCNRQEPESRHPTWNKVALLNEILFGLLHSSNATPPLVPHDTTHLLWVDADAVVVHQDVRVEDLWAELPPSIELLIGEDVTPCCLINAGVWSVRVSEWSEALWYDVFSSKASNKFHNCRYHEQSALLKQLERRGEGLNSVRQPFHSYCGGRSTPKLFPHVCVLPRRTFNTNRADLRASAKEPGLCPTGSGSAVHDADQCDFVFHAAGHPILQCIGEAGTAVTWKPSKPDAIRAVLAHAGLILPPADEADMLASSTKASRLPRAVRDGGRGELAPRPSYRSRYAHRIMN